MPSALNSKETIVESSLNFKALKEEWNSYELEDGTVIELKLIVTKISRLGGAEPDGTPHYLASSTNLMRVFKPEEAKKMKKK